MHAYWDQEKLNDKKNQRQKILWHCPFKTSLDIFIIHKFVHLIWLNFHLKVYGIPYTQNYTVFRGISRYWTVKNSVELRGITRNEVNSV